MNDKQVTFEAKLHDDLYEEILQIAKEQFGGVEGFNKALEQVIKIGLKQ
jgi:hypothetical protein